MHNRPIGKAVLTIFGFVVVDILLVVVSGVVRSVDLTSTILAGEILGAVYCALLYFADFVSFGALTNNWSNLLGLSVWVGITVTPLILFVLYVIQKREAIFYSAIVTGTAAYVLPVVLDVMGILKWCGP